MKQAFDDVIASLTEPRRFYTERYPQLSQNYALALGLGVSWIAATLKWLVRVLNHETFFDGLVRIRAQLMQLPLWRDLPTSIWAQNPNSHASLFPGWLAEAASVALFPFSFLIQIVLTAVAMTVGGYLFIRKREGIETDRPDINHFMKIGALASTPVLVGAILSFLPLGLGTLIGWVYGFFMLLFAVHLRYRISMLRGFAVVATPWVALALVGACFIGLFGAVIIGLFGSIFSA